MSSVTKLVAVILLGGAGTRLWPVSRATLPKPLASLIGDGSLLQHTARRVIACAAPERVITVGARSLDFLVRRQLAEVAPELGAHRLLEPCGRNTAAAIALAALHAGRRFGADAVLWVCPSDHLVTDAAALRRAVRLALPLADAGELVTFGIQPTRPDTGYGYIRAGAPLPAAGAVRHVARFVEKPERAVAEALLAEGDCYWNSGIFLFRADRILKDHGAAPEAGPEGREQMQRHGTQHWSELFRQAKDVGEVGIHACSLSMEMFDITKDDLDPMVDDVEGVASFFAEADGSVTFI